MSHLRAAALTTLLLASAAFAQPTTETTLPPPAPQGTPRNRLLDVSADVLAPGENQLGIFYGYYGRGIIPRLQLSSHFAAYLLTLVNVSAKYQLLDRPELRLSVGAGAYWLAAGALLKATVGFVPAEVRATVPLSEKFELNLAGLYRWSVLNIGEVRQNFHGLSTEATLVRHDRLGAFALRGRVPLFTSQSIHLDKLLGKSDVTGALTLDDLSAWSVLLARDHLVGETAHIRLGMGYRHRPGLLFIESIGNFLFELDVYWRWGGTKASL